MNEWCEQNERLDLCLMMNRCSFKKQVKRREDILSDGSEIVPNPFSTEVLRTKLVIDCMLLKNVNWSMEVWKYGSVIGNDERFTYIVVQMAIIFYPNDTFY